MTNPLCKKNHRSSSILQATQPSLVKGIKYLLSILYAWAPRVYPTRCKRVGIADGVWKGWNWRSEGDLLLNDAYFTPSGAGASASYARASSLGAKSTSMVGAVTSSSQSDNLSGPKSEGADSSGGQTESAEMDNNKPEAESQSDNLSGPKSEGADSSRGQTESAEMDNNKAEAESQSDNLSGPKSEGADSSGGQTESAEMDNNKPEAEVQLTVDQQSSHQLKLSCTTGSEPDPQLQIENQEPENMCCTCLENPADKDLLPCKYNFCRACVTKYCLLRIKDRVTHIKCPAPDCKTNLSDELVQKFVGEEIFEDWVALINECTSVSYCPQCHSDSLKDDISKCPRCSLPYCSHCKLFHLSDKCVSPRKQLGWLKERQHSTNVAPEIKKMEREFIYHMLSTKEAFRDGKRCPSCGMVIVKDDGCNTMKCSRCQKLFCFVCGKEIKDLFHFGAGKCSMFTQEQLRQERHQVYNHVEANIGVVRRRLNTRRNIDQLTLPKNDSSETKKSV